MDLVLLHLAAVVMDRTCRTLSKYQTTICIRQTNRTVILHSIRLWKKRTMEVVSHWVKNNKAYFRLHFLDLHSIYAKLKRRKQCMSTKAISQEIEIYFGKKCLWDHFAWLKNVFLKGYCHTIHNKGKPDV